ncbi:hypothetical protein PIB30_018944 [Stylosanthes scabra]|uniref:Uncharacterized protein n=1 Tax=Stylosanthes scabra TaxID=79078 RepID=A0ABU6Y8K8_9FABA|nr:hypothetical protein [Stylosanthes scabra]
MEKKKSCQNVKVPRPLNAVECKLYGWVEEAIFTQPSMVLGDSLPEIRCNMGLTEEAAAEGDFILKAAGPSDRLPLRADEDSPHFLEVMTRCRVAVSQLHLNGWGPLRTFEKVCLHFGFRPTSRLFLYIYDILIPPTGYGFISFRARQGCKLFGIFEESIQEFKWHYFKVLPAPGRRAFWLDDEGRPFPWVYWNREVKDFVIHELDPLETAVFEFLVSLPAGLPKRNSLTCRWILDNDDTVVGKYLDDLLLVEMKKTKLDRMMEMMADPARMAPRSVPSSPPPAASKAKKSSSKWERLERMDVEVEETAKEDPDANLRQKRRRREKGKEDDIINRVLGDDAAWEHAVNPLDLSFPKKFNYRKALDTGLTSASLRKPLQGMLPDQLLGESWRLQCQALTCQQLGLEAALKAKTKTEEELLPVKDQLFVLKVKRDSALEYIPLKEKADSLAQQLSQKEVEHKSALERVAQLETAQLSVSNDQKRAYAAESSVKSLTVSLETAQAELRKSREEADYWCTEWKSLGTEAQEMCQETLEIVLDQVSHLCPGVDFSAITLKTRWDLKGKRIHVLEELRGGAEVAKTLLEVVSEQQQGQGNTSAGVSGECPI